MTKETNKTHKERKTQLKALIESETVIRLGDQLVINMGETQGGLVPIAVFVVKNGEEEKDNVYLATPAGIILFKAKALHELSQKKAEEIFLRNFDLMLDQKTKHTDIISSRKKVPANG